jgi:hypothetical protein
MSFMLCGDISRRVTQPQILPVNGLNMGHRPHSRLRAVADADLTKETLHVNFDGRLGNVEHTCDTLVGITSGQVHQDQVLSGG